MGINVFILTRTVTSRLNARFPIDGAALEARKVEVVESLKDVSDGNKKKAAIAAMEGAIGALNGQNLQAQLEYLRQATDLQVSKGGGLLAFTAIIAAIAGIAFEKFAIESGAFDWPLWAGVLALLASGMSLIVVWSNIPTHEQFRNSANEIRWLSGLLAIRGFCVNGAVLLSVAATLVLGWGIVDHKKAEPVVQVQPAPGN